MLKFDKDDLVHLLTAKGFRVVDMKKPIGIINGRERNAHPRRYYHLKHLVREIHNLWTNGVRVIGVYKVSSVSDVWGLHGKDPDGMYVRLAYYADWGVRGGEHLKHCVATEGCVCTDILYARKLLFSALKVPEGFLAAE